MSSRDSAIPNKKSSLRINRYSVLAHVYFFFNSVALPFGLLYTQLLSPVFYYWLVKQKKKPVLMPLLAFLVPFDLIHLLLGVDLRSFAASNILFICTYIGVCAASWFVNHYQSLDKIFRQILKTNFYFTLIAIVVFFTPYRDVLWYINKFTQGVEDYNRLALLTYEASYYSLLLVPLVFYFLLRVSFGLEKRNPTLTLFMILFPLLLSMSIGVLGAVVISFAVLYYVHRDKVFVKKGFFYPLFICTVAGIVCFLVMLIFFSDNALFVRLSHVFTGVDSSANGRTVDSFGIAWRIAGLKSIWLGSGLGQTKILAPEMIQLYYNYWGELAVVRIPNAMGETLAIFGIAGVVIRLGVILWFFLKTRVWDNYFRLLLFVFVFIYQFTGSFIINIVEYMIWVLAFSNVFPEFNVKPEATPQNKS